MRNSLKLLIPLNGAKLAINILTTKYFITFLYIKVLSYQNQNSIHYKLIYLCNSLDIFYGTQTTLFRTERTRG